MTDERVASLEVLLEGIEIQRDGSRRRASTLLSLLEGYGRHFDWCPADPIAGTPIRDCTCGLTATLTEYRDLEKRVWDHMTPEEQGGHVGKQTPGDSLDVKRLTVALWGMPFDPDATRFARQIAAEYDRLRVMDATERKELVARRRREGVDRRDFR